MSDIDKKLEHARDRATNYGLLYGNKETADDYLKVTYAQLYEDAPVGTVPERDSWIRRQKEYQDAIDRKKDAYSKWKCAETYMKLLMVEAEVWRTEQANNRYMDKAHQ